MEARGILVFLLLQGLFLFLLVDGYFALDGCGANGMDRTSVVLPSQVVYAVFTCSMCALLGGTKTGWWNFSHFCVVTGFIHIPTIGWAPCLG
jgi:hypothetical protein